MKNILLGMASPLALMTALSIVPATAFAADADTDAGAAPIEEVVVSGLRGSLRQAEDIKRNSDGIVDAISSEDIGKFPDGNLAESIQHVPGVTIDRYNGEGSRITVRGLGADYNLITLNGRTMPAMTSPGIGNSQTRAFDLENLSADSVSGMSVYKTGQADVPSGGIGSTIDIQTARPLDLKDFTASFQAKGNADTSVGNVGRSVTPEVSGLISDTFAHGHIGLLLNGSHSERDSRQELEATNNNYNINVPFNNAVVTNQNTNPFGNFWAPKGNNYGYEDHQRTRDNAQAVLQIKPVESVVATLDYTYAQLREAVQTHTFGSWYSAGNINTATINPEGLVTNMTEISNPVGQGANDFAITTNDEHYVNTLNSMGANVKWDITSNLTATVDAHHSFAGSGNDWKSNDNGFLILGVPDTYGKTYTNNGTGIPLTQWFSAPGVTENVLASGFVPHFGQNNLVADGNKVDEQRVDLRWKNPTDSILSDIKIGFAHKDQTDHYETFGSGNVLENYYINRSGWNLANLLTPVSTSSILGGFKGGGSQNLMPRFYTFNLQQMIAAETAQYGNLALASSHTPLWGATNGPSANNLDNYVEEQTTAGYITGDLAYEAYGMLARLRPGLRYEVTNVTGTALVPLPTTIDWTSPTEFHTIYAAGSNYNTSKSSYHELLPNVDASLNETDDLVSRISYSQTITRPSLGDMAPALTVASTPAPGQRTANTGNPSLQPFKSNNFDLSQEWYFNKDSYLSAGFFNKNVSNFIVNTTTNGPAFGLTDPLVGAAAKKAAGELAAAGQTPTQAAIYYQIVKDQGGNTVVASQAGDPLVQWQVGTYSNAQQIDLHGFEFAAQYAFGDTGFGGLASVSLPAGGAHFNNLLVSGAQFAVPGLSKSYSLTGYYEKNGIQVRAVYNWRDKFYAGNAPGDGQDPLYVAARGQLDLSASYELPYGLVAFVNAINVTGEGVRQYSRFTDMTVAFYANDPFVQFGMRYKF